MWKKHFNELTDLVPETLIYNPGELTPFLFADVNIHKKNGQYFPEQQRMQKQ